MDKARKIITKLGVKIISEMVTHLASPEEAKIELFHWLKQHGIDGLPVFDHAGSGAHGKMWYFTLGEGSKRAMYAVSDLGWIQHVIPNKAN